MKTLLSFFGVVIVVALADRPALASIVLPGQNGPGCFHVGLLPTADADAGATDGLSSAAPAEHQRKAPFVDKYGFRADHGTSAGAPSTSSQSGPSPAALWNEAVPLPECLLVKRLTDSNSLFLPTGPPFELLRPA